jgi:hypothetical protein
MAEGPKVEKLTTRDEIKRSATPALEVSIWRPRHLSRPGGFTDDDAV